MSPTPDPRTPDSLRREYLYTPKGLLDALGLEGDKVYGVTFEFGVFSVWTKEEPK